jgi:hypothetical protein
VISGNGRKEIVRLIPPPGFVGLLRLVAHAGRHRSSNPGACDHDDGRPIVLQEPSDM